MRSPLERPGVVPRRCVSAAVLVCAASRRGHSLPTSAWTRAPHSEITHRQTASRKPEPMTTYRASSGTRRPEHSAADLAGSGGKGPGEGHVAAEGFALANDVLAPALLGPSYASNHNLESTTDPTWCPRLGFNRCPAVLRCPRGQPTPPTAPDRPRPSPASTSC